MENRPRPSISVSPEKVFGLLAACIGLLVLASVSVGRSISTFYLLHEHNLPTFFSALLLLMAAALLALISMHQKEDYQKHWALLSLLFLYIALDESLILHERAITPLREAVGASGVFYYAWIIPVIPLLLLLAWGYLGFLRALPRQTALLTVTGGLLYVGGAIGMEMVGGWLVDNAVDPQTTAYVVVASVEETMEMSGVAVFIYALLDYLRARRAQVGFGAHRAAAFSTTTAGQTPPK